MSEKINVKIIQWSWLMLSALYCWFSAPGLTEASILHLREEYGDGTVAFYDHSLSQSKHFDRDVDRRDKSHGAREII